MQLKYFRIAGRYLNLFLFDPSDFLTILSKIGYTSLIKMPPKPFKGRIGLSGPIAKKSSVIIDMDMEKCIIGLSSIDIPTVLKEFNEIEKIVKDGLLINLKPYFYEVLIESEILSEKDPIVIFKNISRKIELIGKISKKLGCDSQLFGIRICNMGSIPDSPNWLDIEVIPAIEKPHKVFRIYIVFRKQKKEEIYNFCENLEHKINDLLLTLINFASEK